MRGGTDGCRSIGSGFKNSTWESCGRARDRPGRHPQPRNYSLSRSGSQSGDLAVAHQPRAVVPRRAVQRRPKVLAEPAGGSGRMIRALCGEMWWS